MSVTRDKAVTSGVTTRVSHTTRAVPCRAVPVFLLVSVGLSGLPTRSESESSVTRGSSGSDDAR